MEWIQLLIGTLLLSYGKKIVWLLVTVVTFFFGQFLFSILFPMKDQFFILAASAILAVIFTILVLVIKKSILILVGLLGGGYFAITINTNMELQCLAQTPQWMIFIAGGIVGIILSLLAFNGLTILFCAFAGSYLILHVFSIDSFFRLILFIPLCVLGVYLQMRLTTKKLQTTTT